MSEIDNGVNGALDPTLSSESVDKAVGLKQNPSADGSRPILFPLLEKIVSKPSDEGSRAKAVELIRAGTVLPLELEFAKVLALADGEIDFSVFKPEIIKSKKLLSFALKNDPCLFSLDDLLTMSLEVKYKSNRPAVADALRRQRDRDSAHFDLRISEVLKSIIGSVDEKIISVWVETLLIPLDVAVPAQDAALILSAIYSRIEPGKKMTNAVRQLFVAIINWLTQHQNLGNLNDVVTNAAQLGPGAFARIIQDTKQMPFEVGSPRYHLVLALLHPRERKTVTVLSQSGVLKDFSNADLGILAESEMARTAISSNESTLLAVQQECAKRLRSSDLADVHYWLLKWPAIRTWISEEAVIARLHTPHDWITQLLFEKGHHEGVNETRTELGAEIQALRVSLEDTINDLEKMRLVSEAKITEISNLKDQLRLAANQSRDARSDQIRQAQIDLLTLMIELINSIEIIPELPEMVATSIRVARNRLTNFGVSCRYEVGDVVRFEPQDHLASGITPGQLVKILTPCYFLANSDTDIALVKARVLPQ